MYFSPFRIDPITATVWRGDRPVRLSLKSRLILECLVTHPAQPVPKDVLMQAAWPDIHVDGDNLKVHIHELRRALGDDARRPRYIETLLGLGYRFVAPISVEPTADDHHQLVGHEDALERLSVELKCAQAGSPTFVLVTGEIGAGKTTLCERFATRVPSDSAWVARGQCAEVTALVELYAPILDALDDLRRNTNHFIADAFRSCAPTWLTRLQGLPSAPARGRPKSRELHATQLMMAAEFLALFERLTRDRLLILIIEDLQWSDEATLRLLRDLQRRRDRLRVLVIGTCRTNRAGSGFKRAAAVRERLGLTPVHELALTCVSRQPILDP